MNNNVIKYITVFMVLILVGCNNSDNGKPTDTSPPELTLEQLFTVDERVIVELKVNATDDSGIASYQWKQKSGIPVTLKNSEQKNASFTAPSIQLIQGVQVLIFEVSVTNNQNVTAQSDVEVKVQPISKAPDITVPESISNKSGAFTTLNWEITHSEPISSIELTNHDNLIRNINMIDNNSASFNVPVALKYPNNSTLNLTIEDEDGNSTTESIIVTGELANTHFEQPRLIYEYPYDINHVSNELSVLSISSIDSFSNEQALKYIDDQLVVNNELDLSHIPEAAPWTGKQYFVDFNQDGFTDIITMTANGNCDQIQMAEYNITINFRENSGFSEPEVIVNLGCIYVQTDQLPPSIINIKDFDGDGNLDIGLSKHWYLYNKISNLYEIDNIFDSNYYFNGFDRYLSKTPFDINLDNKIDIVDTTIQSVELCGSSWKTNKVCSNLVWAEKKTIASYAEYVTLDNELGTYSNFRMVDVNQDGKGELVVNFTPWNDGSDEMRWYVLSDNSVQMKSIEEVSHFVNLYGESESYFINIGLYQETLTLYEYNQVEQKPVINEVQRIALDGMSYQGYILHDIEQDGDIDVVMWHENKVFLIENTYK